MSLTQRDGEEETKILQETLSPTNCATHWRIEEEILTAFRDSRVHVLPSHRREIRIKLKLNTILTTKNNMKFIQK